jgi:quaternary ammonium compound-resistance protein SugE
MERAWILIVSAGLLEVGFAVTLKLSDGFSNVLLGIVAAVCGFASFALLSFALKDLPVGAGYAVWTGIGAVGTAVVGIVLLGESASLARVAAIATILVGIIALGVVESR